MNKLTEMQCKNSKATDKPYKLFDGGGLYLEVTAQGSKLWRLKYRSFDARIMELMNISYKKVIL